MAHRVAVLGGGPAGAVAAEKLARAGVETVLFDEKLAWEKPCGGGLTYKAYTQYPFLYDPSTPKRLIHETRLGAPEVGCTSLRLTHPIIVYSRRDLNGMLLARAEAAGVDLCKTRVTGASWDGRSWQLQTQNGGMDADFCIVATGARNPLRQFGTEWRPENTMTALGYYLDVQQEHIDIQFFDGLAGYLWLFPRDGHLAAGICGKRIPATRLRELLEKYLAERGLSWEGGRFYGHVLPSLEQPAWRSNRVAGEGWMAVGDAAGLVDPLTGEGIYYAVRSADLAADTLIADTHPPQTSPDVYRQRLAQEFLEEMESAAHLCDKFYWGKLLQLSIPSRVVQLVERSADFRELVQDLFAGTQAYAGIKQRLLAILQGAVRETAFHPLLQRLLMTVYSR